MDKKTIALLAAFLLACASTAHLYFDRDRVAGELLGGKENRPGGGGLWVKRKLPAIADNFPLGLVYTQHT